MLPLRGKYGRGNPGIKGPIDRGKCDNVWWSSFFSSNDQSWKLKPYNLPKWYRNQSLNTWKSQNQPPSLVSQIQFINSRPQTTFAASVHYKKQEQQEQEQEQQQQQQEQQEQEHHHHHQQ